MAALLDHKVATSLARTRAENIALLFLLDQVPSPPGTNPHPEFAKDERNRALSLRGETHLVSAISFLAGVSDDPNRVTAACVEEDHDARTLRVKLAINKGTPSDHVTVLERIKHGLQNIFNVLTRTVHDNESAAVKKVLTAIISLCRRRLLSRLHIIGSGYRKSRKLIASVLSEVLEVLRNKCNLSKNSHPLFTQMEPSLQRLENLLNGCDQNSGDDVLVEIVMTSASLAPDTDFSTLLKCVNKKDIHPDSKSHLIHTLSRISTYDRVAQYLLRFSSILNRFPTVQIDVINLGEAEFWLANTKGYLPKLQSLLAPIAQRYNIAEPERSIYNKTKATLADASQKFSDVCLKSWKESKIHAEIQILAYYDLHPSELPPRVIQSAKKACFLCNLFFQIHGKYHIPKTHGRLYPAWRLPPIASHELFQIQLNTKLEGFIAKTMRRLASNSYRRLYPCPNETAIFSLPGSNVSSTGFAGLVEESEEIAFPTEDEDTAEQTTYASLDRRLLQFHETDEKLSELPSEEPFLESSTETIVEIKNASTHAAEERRSTSDLLQNQERSLEIPTGLPYHHPGGLLDVYFEYTTGRTWRGSQTLRCRIQEFDEEEASLDPEYTEGNTFLADMLPTDTETTTKNKRLYLRLGSRVMRIIID